MHRNHRLSAGWHVEHSKESIMCLHGLYITLAHCVTATMSTTVNDAETDVRDTP